MMRVYVCVALCLAAVSGCFFYGRSQYNKGYTAATAAISLQIAAAEREAQRRQPKASAVYEEQRADFSAKERVQYVQIQKIVEKPVYVHDCLDDDGVQQLNRAISGDD